MKVYNAELQRLQEEMMEEKRLEAKLAELKRQQEEKAGGTEAPAGRTDGKDG